MAKPLWTLAVDPGLRLCGVSLFEGKTLNAAWLVKNPIKEARGPETWHRMASAVLQSWLKRVPTRGQLTHHLVLEVPQVYFSRRGGGKASDLIELAGVVGAVAAACPVMSRVHFLPREWKGQTPKEIHNARVVAKLSPVEKGFLAPVTRSLRHNMIDAVGLGLFHLKRMSR